MKPDKPGTDAHLGMVARIGWAAAVFGAPSLAEQCTRRAATSQVRVHLGFLPRCPTGCRHKLQCWRPLTLFAQLLWSNTSLYKLYMLLLALHVQDLGPRVWADLTGLLLSLKAAPEAALGPGSDSSGSGAALDAAALRARREVLEGADEAASAFLKLGDVEGIHNAAVLAWNAGELWRCTQLDVLVMLLPWCAAELVNALRHTMYMCFSA